MQNYLKKWKVFIIERFSPFTYLPSIGLYTVSSLLFAARVEKHAVSFQILIFLSLVSILFFFTLRLLDEIKDFDNDQIVYPHRPLPRGLFTPTHIKQTITSCLSVIAICFFYFGRSSFLAIVFVLIYIVILYNEFFLRKFIRARLTLYAVIHTFVVVLFTIALLSPITNAYMWQYPGELLLYSFSLWPLFMIFEVSRKIYPSKEEKKQIPSYSKVFGRLGSVLFVELLIFLTLLCLLFTKVADIPHFVTGGISFMVLVFVSGLMYVWEDTRFWNRVFQTASQMAFYLVYIVMLFYSFFQP